jgi:hypothetical protein
MFRKTILALSAVAALGAISFTTTEASAHGYGYSYGYGHRPVYAYRYYAPTYCSYKKVWNSYTYSWDFVKVCF